LTGDGWKLGLTVTGVAGLAGCGFTLSFASLRDLAVASGILPELAFLWPLVVDGFIVVATAAAFRLKAKGARVTWYPWAALITFAAVSVAGNALHAADSSTRTVAVWVATVVSAVPAVALLVASHLLAVMAEHGRAAQPVGDVVELTATVTPATAAAAAASVSAIERAPVTAAAPAPAPESARSASPAEASVPAAVDGDFVEWVQRMRRDGVAVTGRLVAETFGLSDRTARRRVTQVKAARPDLFTGEVPA